MLTVDEALDAILAEVKTPAEFCELPLIQALGRVLQQDVESDVDSPPFDKSLMDGFAIRTQDVPEGRAKLHLLEEVMAGQVPRKKLKAGFATRIMTGAPIPDRADAVVRVEDTNTAMNTGGNVIVSIEGPPVTVGQNIMQRATSTRAGDCVVAAGTVLRPQEIGALAEAGQASVTVFPKPRVAILATGDELVPISTQPEAGQIRNSNEAMLAAQMNNAGAEVELLGIARDNREHLRQRIDAGLNCDLLLLSGGVSAGDLDLVPSVLAEAGVRQVFHKVNLKPGKPLWFGVFHHPLDGATKYLQICYVFGLPGNPVSSMVCAELFVRTAIRRMLGIPQPRPSADSARMTHEFTHRGDRPTYHPARTQVGAEGRTVSMVAWQGSSDLRGTTAANSLAHFPAGDQTYSAGALVEVYHL